MLEKFTNIPCAVSGRSHAWAAESSTGPTKVLNIRLNWRGAVRGPLHLRQPLVSGSSWSARYLSWQSLHSTSGSVNPAA